MKAVKSFGKWLKTRKQPQFTGLVVFGAVFAAIGVTLLLRSLAAGERLYLTPDTASVQTGQDVTVTLRLNLGTSSINAIDANIAYDDARLQFKSVDTSASAFSIEAATSNNNGVVNIARGTIGALFGDVEVAKITFTAISDTSVSTSLTVSGVAAQSGENVSTLTFGHTTVSVTAPTPPSTSGATFTIEPTVGSPIVGSQFGLRVYVTTEDPIQGGEVSVVLPSGLAYSGTLDTAGTAFNPATTVAGTTAQRVNLVFVTQANNVTGKQLIATIPVNSSSAGARNITMENARAVDIDEEDMTPITADAFSITVNAATLPAPQVRRNGGTQEIAATENITDLRQAFSIGNFDTTATYTATLAGQNLAVSGGNFSIPTSLMNGNHQLLVTATRNGASGNSTYTIRLRSPNVDRVGCVGLDDLLQVNGGYGASSTNFDLNFDGAVSLIDLLTVTQSWTGACI